MRIQCGTLEEFIEELDIEAESGRVWRRIVRLRIERVPEQQEAVSFQVLFIATVILGNERPEQLLEFSGFAGRDGGRGEFGTKTAEEWQANVRVLAEKHGLKLRRGRYQFV